MYVHHRTNIQLKRAVEGENVTDVPYWLLWVTEFVFQFIFQLIEHLFGIFR